MKFNWGHGLAIVMGLFVIVITAAVLYTSSHVTELVTEDYYQQEITYQKVIDAKKNSDNIVDSIKYYSNPMFIDIVIAPSIDIQNAEGEIIFYRPNKSNLDVNYDIKKYQMGDTIRIPRKNLVTGKYELTLKWKKDNLDYIWEKSINI